MRAIFVFCKQTAADVNMSGRFLILDLLMGTTSSQSSVKLDEKQNFFINILIFVNKQLILLFNYLKKHISDFDPQVLKCSHGP